MGKKKSAREGYFCWILGTCNLKNAEKDYQLTFFLILQDIQDHAEKGHKNQAIFR